jgi:integrase
MLQLVNITSSIERRYIMKANPKELQEIYNLVCKTQWDLGRDESVKDRAKKIIEFWGEDTFITDVDESMIDGLVAELRDRSLSNATINRYLSALSTMITFCLRRHGVYNLKRKPYISWLKEPKHELRFVTLEEESLLISLLRSWNMKDDADFFIMLLDTGMRLSELQNLKVGDCYGDRIVLTHTKNNESRGVPLTKRCQKIVERFSHDKKPGERLFRHFAQWRPNSSWRKVRKAMNLEHDKRFGIHACRRTLVHRLLNADVPSKAV